MRDSLPTPIGSRCLSQADAAASILAQMVRLVLLLVSQIDTNAASLPISRRLVIQNGLLPTGWPRHRKQLTQLIELLLSDATRTTVFL